MRDQVMHMKMKLPVGISNYRELRSEKYYAVDKTLMIQEFLEHGSKVTLVTRPRRFGKTLNLSMMAEFFDITKDSNEIFKGTKIMETEYAKEMNQYPVIFLSFLNAKGDEGNVIKYIKKVISREYERYIFIVEKLDVRRQKQYVRLFDHFDNTSELSLRNVNDAISFLTRCLYEYYDKKVMVYIDEYDTPFIEAHLHGFYDSIHVDLATLLRTVLKGNDAMQYGFLTGIQRVAKESVFSDLNNIEVCSVKDENYAEYFGFTKEETEELLAYYGREYNQDVKEMYDGYNIGGIDIYNPWSILEYAKHERLEPYWVNTSSNTMIKNAMDKAEAGFNEDYEYLIEHSTVDVVVNFKTSFYEQADDASLWGLLVNAGYLTVECEVDIYDSRYRLRIPNGEVRNEFKNLVAYHLQISPSDLIAIRNAFKEQDLDEFLKVYQRILLQDSSYFDLVNENSYHMLMLGICLYVKPDYEVISNREEGEGRCDLILKAKKTELASYVLEFKYGKNENQLEKDAHGAVDQIREKGYDRDLSGKIIHVGLAHSGKRVKMVWVER